MTIKQRTALVEIDGGRRIEVRRMRWKAAREFLKKASGIIADIYRDAAPSGTFMQLLSTKLPGVVAGSDELAALVATQSTDLTLDDFDNLDQLSALAVLDAALEVNFDEDVKNFVGRLGEKLAGLIPAEKTPTPTTT